MQEERERASLTTEKLTDAEARLATAAAAARELQENLDDTQGQLEAKQVELQVRSAT